MATHAHKAGEFGPSKRKKAKIKVASSKVSAKAKVETKTASSKVAAPKSAGKGVEHAKARHAHYSKLHANAKSNAARAQGADKKIHEVALAKYEKKLAKYEKKVGGSSTTASSRADVKKSYEGQSLPGLSTKGYDGSRKPPAKTSEKSSHAQSRHDHYSKKHAEASEKLKSATGADKKVHEVAVAKYEKKLAKYEKKLGGASSDAPKPKVASADLEANRKKASLMSDQANNSSGIAISANLHNAAGDKHEAAEKAHGKAAAQAEMLGDKDLAAHHKKLAAHHADKAEEHRDNAEYHEEKSFSGKKTTPEAKPDARAKATEWADSISKSAKDPQSHKIAADAHKTAAKSHTAGSPKHDYHMEKAAAHTWDAKVQTEKKAGGASGDKKSTNQSDEAISLTHKANSPSAKYYDHEAAANAHYKAEMSKNIPPEVKKFHAEQADYHAKKGEEMKRLAISQNKQASNFAHFAPGGSSKTSKKLKKAAAALDMMFGKK